MSSTRAFLVGMATTSFTLLQRVRRRDDHAAWDRFVTLYTPLLLRWSSRAGLNKIDAADLVQDVFVKLLAELPRFEYDPRRGQFRSWLKTITVNECRTRQRKIRTVDAAEECPSQLPDETDALTTLWDREYHVYLVEQALAVMRAKFEPKTWQAAWEMIVHEQSAAAAGQKLGLSEAAVYVAKSRVLRRLRHELDGLLD